MRRARRLVAGPGARRDPRTARLLPRRAGGGPRPDRRGRGPRVPEGVPKALTEAEVELLLGAVAGDDPRALAGPGDPRAPLHDGDPHLRTRRAVDRRPRCHRAASSGSSARARRSASCRSAASPSRPVAAWLGRRGRPRHRGQGRATARRDAQAMFISTRGRRMSRQAVWTVVNTAARVASGWRTGSRRTCCATRSPRICSTTAPTSGSSRSCSATPRSRRPRCTRRSPRSTSAGRTSRPTPAPAAGRAGGGASVTGGPFGHLVYRVGTPAN